MRLACPAGPGVSGGSSSVALSAGWKNTPAYPSKAAPVSNAPNCPTGSNPAKFKKRGGTMTSGGSRTGGGSTGRRGATTQGGVVMGGGSSVGGGSSGGGG